MTEFCPAHHNPSTVTSCFPQLLMTYSWFLDIHLSSLDIHQPTTSLSPFLLHPLSLPPNPGKQWGAYKAGRPMSCLTSSQTLPPLADTTCVQDCPKATTLMRTATGVPPATALVGHVRRHSMQCLSCQPGWFQLGQECLTQCREG